MRIPVQRRETAQSIVIPAPVGGWNARDPVSSMPETDAIQLDNMLNVAGSVQIRNGNTEWARTTGHNAIGTLAVWNGPSSSQLWAFSRSSTPGLEAFNISTTGTKTADAGFQAFGRTHTPYLSTTMFNNVAGHYLYVCCEDGGDVPAHYNGTAWAEPAITGVTASNLVHVNLFKYRLYFVEKDSLNIWYLPVDAIAGAASKFPLGGYFNKGGYILATGTWTVDGGDGVNDLFCVVTSVGQVAVFQGDDPTSASSWSLVGVFDIAEPLGKRRCFSKFGADLYLLTVDGMFSMASVMAGRVMGDDAFTEKVRTAFSNYARDFKDERGWFALYYPRGRYFMINVPTVVTQSGVDPTTVQFVFSTTTKTWARFTGQHAVCWAVFNDRLYFATHPFSLSVANGRIDRADDGQSDLLGQTVAGVTLTIPVVVRQAFTHFGDPSRTKQVTLARPVFETDATTFGLRVQIDFDYTQATYTNTVTAIEGPGTYSGGRYDNANAVQREGGGGGGGIGRCAALSFKANVKNAKFGWLSTEWLVKPAGVLS